MATPNFSYLFYVFLSLSMIIAAYAGYAYDVENHKTEASKILGKDWMPRVFSVQGVVYCKSGPNVFPLKGGIVRITCLGIDKYGYETAPFSILSPPTDANGYFLAKLLPQLREEDGFRISQCKAFLHSSPTKSCPTATDVGKGSSGAPLSAYRAIGSNGLRLYSVGPFVYDSQPQQSIPSRY